MDDLIGIGLYTPAEASRLLAVPAARIARWLRGHSIEDRAYNALWQPEVTLGDNHIYLGFRDLMEVRVADAFIKLGISAIRVRRAVAIARDVLGQDHPLATNRFRTDGREIFLHVLETEEDGRQRERLLNIFRQQYEFKSILDPILKTVDFSEDGGPILWWPRGRNGQVVVDPARSFGQPIDATSSVPTATLAAAAKQEGIRGAARAFEVSEAAVRRSVDFEDSLVQRMAA